MDRIGASLVHRMSFAPLKDHKAASTRQTTKQIGDDAEQFVESYLRQQGHEVIARNWRTKYCEIDIISKYNDTLFFTEVKYRKNNSRGDGIEAITPKKLQQMSFAAEFFVVRHEHKVSDLRLAVADVTGSPLQLEAYLELR